MTLTLWQVYKAQGLNSDSQTDRFEFKKRYPAVGDSGVGNRTCRPLDQIRRHKATMDVRLGSTHLLIIKAAEAARSVSKPAAPAPPLRLASKSKKPEQVTQLISDWFFFFFFVSSW